MINKSRLRFLVFVLAGFVLLYGVLTLLQSGIDRSRRGLLDSPTMSAKERLIDLGATVMLGSFRSAAVAGLWGKASQLKERNEWVELDGIYRLIAKLQPTEINAYTFLVWDMAYNVQHGAETVVEGWRWVKKALAFGEQGAERNPNHPQIWNLYWQIAWVYSHRCVDVGDKRTQYFAQQVLKEHGKHPYLVAADWYEKAWRAATRTEEHRNPAYVANRLQMWAHCYSELAKLAEERDAYEEMMDYRKEAVKVHKRLMKSFAEYKENGEDAVGKLGRLMRLHQQRRRADELRKQERLDEELRLRLQLADEWSALLRESPALSEAQRNVDRAADDLALVAGSLGEPGEKARLLRRVLGLRFHAADPRRRSEKAVKKLEAALAPYDEQLGPQPSRSELLRNRGLIRFVSGAWARIVANAPGNVERAAKAHVAIRRYDLLFESLEPEQQRIEHRQLVDHWYTLIVATDIDAPRGRQRIREAALVFETSLLGHCPELTENLQQFQRLAAPGAPPSERTRITTAIVGLTLQARAEADEAFSYWGALLRRDRIYAEDAPVAEKHLRTIAEAMEAVQEAAEEALGPRRVRSRHDPRSFFYSANAIWRALHEYDPGRELYLEKRRESPRRKRRPINIHELDGHKH